MNKSIFSSVRFAAIGLFGLVALSACKKDKMPAIDPTPKSTLGVYVLCEGLYTQNAGTNNSSITYFDLATSLPEKDFFKKQNGIELGTNASDLKQYGSKMYCVVTGTIADNKDSYLEVMNISTGKSLKRIPFSDQSGGFLPRYVAFYKGKAYVSGYDGYVSRIDTGSLTIEARLKVGGALEQITFVDNKLYVPNSAHFQFGTSNNASVSVVDLNTFTKIKDIPVNFNPTKIAALNNGDVFVVTKGNYVDILAKVDKVNTITDTKVESSAINLSALSISGDKGYAIVEGEWPEPGTLKVFNTATGALGDDFITDQTQVVSPYGITVNTLDKTVFVADDNGYSASGFVYCFGENGKKRFSFATGAVPQAAVFNYSYK